MFLDVDGKIRMLRILYEENVWLPAGRRFVYTKISRA